MHWTLVALLGLCTACLATNAAQLASRRTLGVAGMLVCAGWAVQQGYWWATGGDSFALFLACDAAIIGWLLALWWRGHAFGVGDRLIAATIPLTTALGAFAWLNGGHTTESWWTNWTLVAAQMTLGLPPAEWALRHVAAFNRSFDPWKHFNFRKRHA